MILLESLSLQTESMLSWLLSRADEIFPFAWKYRLSTEDFAVKTEISALFSFQAALLAVVTLEAPLQAVPDGVSSRGIP